MTPQQNLDEKWLTYLSEQLQEELKDTNLISGRDLDKIIERIQAKYHKEVCLRAQ